jgi:hypothetical protein
MTSPTACGWSEKVAKGDISAPPIRNNASMVSKWILFSGDLSGTRSAGPATADQSVRTAPIPVWAQM